MIRIHVEKLDDETITFHVGDVRVVDVSAEQSLVSIEQWIGDPRTLMGVAQIFIDAAHATQMFRQGHDADAVMESLVIYNAEIADREHQHGNLMDDG